MKSHNKIHLGLALLVSTLAANNVNAYETKVYPGNECQPKYGSTASFFDSTTRHIANKGSSAAWVTCPIVRSPNANATEGVRIHVERFSGSTGNFVCWLDNMNSNGDWVQYKSDIESGSGKQQLTIVNKPSSSTYYQSLECLLPPGSELHYYSASDYWIY